MGIYGIFILVLTFVYLVYYIVTISMDLYGSGKGKQASTELIKVEGAEEVEPDDDEESPTQIGGTDIFGGKEPEDEPDDSQVLSAEEIAAMATDTMYEESMKAKERMQEIHPKAQVEFSATSEKDELLEYYRQMQMDDASQYHNDEEDEDYE